MPLPKRPSGGATSKNVAPPKFGKSEVDKSIESELSLPELDDFTLPNLSYDEDFDSDSSNEYSPAQTATPDSLSVNDYAPKSINHLKPEPSKSAVSDELDAFEDEDEETRLNRELGLLDDDDFAPVRSSSIEARDEEQNDEQPDFDYESLISTPDTPTDDSFDSALIELEENPLAEEPEDDEFADLLKDLEEIAASDDEPENSQDEDDQESETDPEETDWESALAELEANSEEYSLPMPVDSVDSDEDDEEDDLTSYVREMQDFVPPSNPFAIPENFINPEEPEDEDESEQDEEDFIPPSDPFANPFADEDPKEDPILTDEDEDEEGDSKPRKPKETGLKGKLSTYPSKAKKGLKNYFAKINAELHGEELPNPREDEEDEPFGNQDQDEMEQGGPARGSNRSGLAIFGFLRPIKSLYTGIVNVIFGILTTVLGILSKLPLIGFVFKIALEATKVLRAIAQYIPLAFFIGGLVLTSYLSVARESIIALPDSGGATFNNFQYDSASNSASGVILNTGNIIADVQPTFEIKSIKPGANPVSWVIPETVSTCEIESVQVDIDATMNVTAKCSEPITGFFPRATGELK